MVGIMFFLCLVSSNCREQKKFAPKIFGASCTASPPRRRHRPLHIVPARRSGAPCCMRLSTCRIPHRRLTRRPMDCSMRGPPPNCRYASICPHGSQGCMVHGLQSHRYWRYKLPLENEAIWIQGTIAVVRIRVRESHA